MKKVLVLSLVLVMALAGSAFAAVNFSGEFEAKLESDTFSFLEGDFELKTTPKLNVKVASDEGDWALDMELGNVIGGDAALGKYQLTLVDDYFKAWVWGKDKELSDKGTALGLLTAGKKATDHRVRLEVNAIEEATFIVDLDAQNEVYALANVDIAGYEAGLAAKRAGLNTANPDDTVALWGKANVDIVTLTGEVGATLGEEIALGYGVKAEANITDELKVEAQYLGAQDDFKGDTAKNELFAKATYTETEFQVETSVTQDFDEEANTITASAAYRFSEDLGFGDLFKNDEYFKNTAPAAKVSATIKDFGFGTVRGDVASPVMEDFIWAKAFAEYGLYGYADETKQALDENGDPKVDEDGKDVMGLDSEDTGFKVGVDFYVKATDKLVIKPFASFESIGSVITFGANADYKIGEGATTLGLGVKKVMADDVLDSLNSESISASVKVTF